MTSHSFRFHVMETCITCVVYKAALYKQRKNFLGGFNWGISDLNPLQCEWY